MTGIGGSALGTSSYGLGTPDVAPGGGGKIFRDPATGLTVGSRRIDPETKDYSIDDYGRILGMNNTQQLVLLAVSTSKGSSAMRSLGQELRKIDRITSNFKTRVESTLRSCLQFLVDRGVVEFVGIEVELLGQGVARVHMSWRDLTTNNVETVVIG